MKQSYNLALFGAGTIAKKIAEAAAQNERLCLYAVASRKVENARAFADRYGIQQVFEGYDEMLSDNQIDLVYISTPTKFHYEHIKMCLLAGKNVICEKPFVETAEQAMELKQLAESRKLFLMDALWTMYMPIMDKLSEYTKQIGRINYSTASLGYPSVSKDDSGKLKSKSKSTDGIVVKNCTKLKYENGSARLFSSLLHRSTYMLALIGTKGMIFARKWWFGRFPIIIWKYPFKIDILKFKHEINGYEYELNEAIKCLDCGKTETDRYSLSNTVSVLKWAEQMEIY